MEYGLFEVQHALSLVCQTFLQDIRRPSAPKFLASLHVEPLKHSAEQLSKIELESLNIFNNWQRHAFDEAKNAVTPEASTRRLHVAPSSYFIPGRLWFWMLSEKK